jgi:signal transduction histidine kinase
MSAPSLRTRLWLSYALLILAALGLTALILVVYLLRSPLPYRQSFARMLEAQTALLTDRPDLSILPEEELVRLLESYDAAFDVRLLLVANGGTTWLDSRPASAAFTRLPGRLAGLLSGSRLRDQAGRVWLYRLERLSNRTWLVAAVPRQSVPLLTALRDDILIPFGWSGMAALLLSLLLAYGLARWIGIPLERLAAASRSVPQESRPVPARGPREVQELTRAFNDMAARVQASQRSQRDFVANVSHELKTPLTSIQGFAQAIQDGTAGDPAARLQAAGIILAEAGRMHRMVLDLLDLARMDAGTFEVKRLPVDLAAILRQVSEKFAPQAEAASVRLLLEVGELPVLTADGDRLEQVFTNLVDNAIQYTPAAGQVTLNAQYTDGQVLIEISDTGPGIPEEEIGHIFERFYRADPARAGSGKHGAGLGLAIAREIVLAHAGTISVRSSPGAGSTFTVQLPVSPQA